MGSRKILYRWKVYSEFLKNTKLRGTFKVWIIGDRTGWIVITATGEEWRPWSYYSTAPSHTVLASRCPYPSLPQGRVHSQPACTVWFGTMRNSINGRHSSPVAVISLVLD